MNINYVFLCGIMWRNYGSQDAGKELLRATHRSDPETTALAWAMLARGPLRKEKLRMERNRSRAAGEAEAV